MTLAGFSIFPDLSLAYLGALVAPVIETLAMAAGAMLIACAVGLPLGLVVATRAPGTRALHERARDRHALLLAA